VTGVVEFANPPDGCEIRNNVAGKIVIVIMDRTICLADIIMEAVLEAGGLVSKYSALLESLVLMSFAGLNIAL